LKDLLAYFFLVDFFAAVFFAAFFLAAIFDITSSRSLLSGNFLLPYI
jgi:hypothetical protein